MIPNFISPAFDKVQDALYRFQRTCLVDEKRVTRTTAVFERPTLFGKDLEDVDPGQSILLNRVLVLPVVVIDLALEGLRPLCKSVESASFVLISLGAIFYHMVNPYTADRGKEFKTSIRITVLNFNHAFENLVLGIIKATSVPFLLIAQFMITESTPLSSQPCRESFPLIYTMNIVELQQPKDPYSPQESEPNAVQKWLYSKGIGRSSGALISVVDVIIEIAASTIKAIISGQVLFVGSIATPIFFVAHVVTRNSGWDLYEIFRITFTAYNNFNHHFAHAVSKLYLLPLTIVAQTIKSMWNPLKAQPVSSGLYNVQPQDPVLSTSGVEYAQVAE